MQFYDYHRTELVEMPVICPRVTDGKRCNSEDFELEKSQWLIKSKEYEFQNVRLKCTKCGKTHIKAFDRKAFLEQLELSSLLRFVK